jgi:hypothetical protein
MTTATAINLEDMTTGEAKLTLDKVIKQIADQENEELLVAYDDLVIIAYALENNLQLRDYLMGLTRDGLSVESVAGIVRVLSALVKCAELPAYPIETVLASYMYRLGDSAGALVMLANGISRDYSLAKLLLRVFDQGLDPDNFAIMAQELHGKVVEELTRTQELPANEANR